MTLEKIGFRVIVKTNFGVISWYALNYKSYEQQVSSLEASFKKRQAEIIEAAYPLGKQQSFLQELSLWYEDKSKLLHQLAIPPEYTVNLQIVAIAAGINDPEVLEESAHIDQLGRLVFDETSATREAFQQMQALYINLLAKI